MSKNSECVQQGSFRKLLCPLLDVSAIGLYLTSSMFVGILFGYGMDCYFDTYPWVSGMGLFLGIIAGFRLIWIDTKRIIMDKE